MPRKNKSIYERIMEVEQKIIKNENEIKELKSKLVILNKEKDQIEMNKMFEQAKENNMSIDDVIRALNMYASKNTK